MNYKTEKLKDGVFGPNQIGHTYLPHSYHGPKAKTRKGKSKWAHPASAEYYVFNLADEHDGHIDENGIEDKRWVNDDGKGLYSMVDDCKEVLGKKEERFAYFKNPINDTDPWHGYPVDDILDLGNDLIEHWYAKKLISDSTYLRLMRHKL